MATLSVSVLFSFFLVVVLEIEICVAADFCYQHGTLRYCDYGCCSDTCCFLSAWLIGVIVVGCIVFICVVIAVICCVIKSKGSAGRVVHPVASFQPAGNVTVVNHSGQQAWGHTPYPQGPHPPPTASTPSSPAYSAPAYPPPSQPGPFGQPSQPDQSPFAKAAHSAS